MAKTEHHEHRDEREAELSRNNKNQPVRKNLLDVLIELELLGREHQFPGIDDSLLPAKEIDL